MTIILNYYLSLKHAVHLPACRHWFQLPEARRWQRQSVVLRLPLQLDRMAGDWKIPNSRASQRGHNRHDRSCGHGDLRK
jgi:hypothetical protein